MINLLGFLIILLGFFAPALSGGNIPSIFIFWIGFLLLLLPNKYLSKFSFWLKWARVGVVLNIIGVFLIFLFVKLITNTSLSAKYSLGILLSGANWIVNPVSMLFKRLQPSPVMKMADGSIQLSINFYTAAVTDFFDILVYIVLGTILGKLILMKKTNESSVAN